MKMIRSLWLTAVLASVVGAVVASAQDNRQGSQNSGIAPEVLVQTTVPGVPWKKALVTRVTYQPGARNRKHYHTSQIVFLVLEGSMQVQDDGKQPVTLKVGDTLLVPPGTVHTHWNPSQTEKLVFAEFVLVDDGQRSTVPVE